MEKFSLGGIRGGRRAGPTTGRELRRAKVVEERFETLYHDDVSLIVSATDIASSPSSSSISTSELAASTEERSWVG